jgi:hypothetical protein
MLRFFEERSGMAYPWPTYAQALSHELQGRK